MLSLKWRERIVLRLVGLRFAESEDGNVVRITVPRRCKSVMDKAIERARNDAWLKGEELIVQEDGPTTYLRGPSGTYIEIRCV